MSAANSPNLALKCAIALYRQPTLARNLVHSDLPEGITDVFRIAAEGTDSAGLFADAQGATPQEVHQACLLYLQTVVCHPNARDIRLLGLSEPIVQQKLREHKRLILKWLHPDRNHNSWESKLFLRVQAAAVRLEQSLNGDPLVVVTPMLRRVSTRRLQYTLESPRNNESRSKPWLRFFDRRAIAVLLVLMVLAAGIFAVLMVATDGHGLGFSNEAAN